jgi:hypothetical protein
MTLHEIIDIVCLIICALSLLTFIVIMVRISQLNRRLDDHGNYIYKMMKATDESKESQTSISTDVNKVNETMSSLTSSIRSLVKQKQEAANEKIYPGPQLLQLIDSCITETILMTATLISRQRVPNDPLLMVTDIVTKTFPHVDTTFLEQRIIYIMEDYNRSSTGQKAQ